MNVSATAPKAMTHLGSSVHGRGLGGFQVDSEALEFGVPTSANLTALAA
jgi:hypothetical protein